MSQDDGCVEGHLHDASTRFPNAENAIAERQAIVTRGDLTRTVTRRAS
jgi:hypothetical protein